MGGSLLLWLAAAVWVDWRSRAAAGVCITATVTRKLWYRRKEQHLQPRLRGRSTRKSRRASWPGARRARRCSRKATVSNGSLKSCRTCESGGRSRGGGSSTGCSTGGGSGRACAGLSGELRCRMSAMERPVSRVSGVSGVSRGVGGVGGVGGVECRECRECRNALTLLDTTRTSPLSRWLDTGVGVSGRVSI